jgi:hypothetical protein
MSPNRSLLRFSKWPQYGEHLQNICGGLVGLAVSLSFNANGTMASKAVGYDLAMTAARRRNTHAVNRRYRADRE